MALVAPIGSLSTVGEKAGQSGLSHPWRAGAVQGQGALPGQGTVQ